MTKDVKKIITIFMEINSIPRNSQKEKEISDWLYNWALERNFEVNKDQFLNVLIKIPASSGFENIETVVIQSHMDMVCEKETTSNHNFDTDPIDVIEDGDWIHANGTTLGADNGLGMALMLAIANDKNIGHPPLELLFTADEELAFTGALNLKRDFIEGKTLLNLDVPHEGKFIIGCAGGVSSEILLPLESVSISAKESIVYEIDINGLAGGHSGIDIHRNRANSIKLIANLLGKIKEKIQIISISGGNSNYAIPRDATVIISFSENNREIICDELKKMKEEIILKYLDTEPDINILLQPVLNHNFKKALTPEISVELVDLIPLLPHGVTGMSKDITGLVETSNNLASIRTEGDSIKIISSQRSSDIEKLENLTDKIHTIVSSFGGAVSNFDRQPGWYPNFQSPLLKRCSKIYREKYDIEAEISAVHGCVECGAIGEIMGDMDMISFGLTIENMHTPEERFHIPSLEKLWDFTVDLLKSFKGGRL